MRLQHRYKEGTVEVQEECKAVICIQWGCNITSTGAARGSAR